MPRISATYSVQRQVSQTVLDTHHYSIYLSSEVCEEGELSELPIWLAQDHTEQSWKPNLGVLLSVSAPATALFFLSPCVSATASYCLLWRFSMHLVVLTLQVTQQLVLQLSSTGLWAKCAPHTCNCNPSFYLFPQGWMGKANGSCCHQTAASTQILG